MTLAAAWLGCQAAHVRLLETVSTVSDADVGRPSRLRDWTVGHVLTHLARNAESHVRMLEAAARSEVADQYAGGNVQRAADIEAGAMRTSAALIHDVRRTIERLETAWKKTPAAAWTSGVGRVASGEEWQIANLPFYRWREVEIHHMDLGLGFGWADWSDAYVDTELERTIAELPRRLPEGLVLRLAPEDSERSWARPTGHQPTLVLTAPRRRLLAWLVGRLDDAPGEFPAVGPWRP